jgi:hypothetical protein
LLLSLVAKKVLLGDIRLCWLAWLPFDIYEVPNRKKFLINASLVSSVSSSLRNSALEFSSEERHNVAHGASRGLRHLPSPPSPLPPARERGAEGGVRACEPRARALVE